MIDKKLRVWKAWRSYERERKSAKVGNLNSIGKSSGILASPPAPLPRRSSPLYTSRTINTRIYRLWRARALRVSFSLSLFLPRVAVLPDVAPVAPLTVRVRREVAPIRVPRLPCDRREVRRNRDGSQPRRADRDKLHSPCAADTTPSPCPRRRCRRGHRPATASWTSRATARVKRKKKSTLTHTRSPSGGVCSFLRPRDRLTGLLPSLFPPFSLLTRGHHPHQWPFARLVSFSWRTCVCQACLARGESPRIFASIMTRA